MRLTNLTPMYEAFSDGVLAMVITYWLWNYAFPMKLNPLQVWPSLVVHGQIVCAAVAAGELSVFFMT